MSVPGVQPWVGPQLVKLYPFNHRGEEKLYLCSQGQSHLILPQGPRYLMRTAP